MLEKIEHQIFANCEEQLQRNGRKGSKKCCQSKSVHNWKFVLSMRSEVFRVNNILFLPRLLLGYESTYVNTASVNE